MEFSGNPSIPVDFDPFRWALRALDTGAAATLAADFVLFETGSVARRELCQTL